jgi:hypothetical protein
MTFVLNSSRSPPLKLSLKNFHEQKSHQAIIVVQLKLHATCTTQFPQTEEHQAMVVVQF